MKFWWYVDTVRWGAEWRSVEALARDEGWFQLDRWRLFRGNLCAEGVISARGQTYVSGCRIARENGEHKMWGLTFSNFMFSHTGPLMAGSLLTAMDAPVSGGCVVSPEGP